MVSSFATELLEISSKEPSPSLHMLVVPSNLGIVGFYKDFVEALYEDLGGQASVTAIGHISNGQKVMHIFLQVDSYRHVEIDKGRLHQSYIFMEDSSLVTSSDHTSRTVWPDSSLSPSSDLFLVFFELDSRFPIPSMRIAISIGQLEI